MILLPLQITEIKFSEALIIAVFGFLLVITVLAVLALFVKLLTAIISASTKRLAKNDEKPTENTNTQSNTINSKDDFVYSGYVTLDGVSEQDAAVIMAIVSDKTGIPLERLAFNSIKRLNQNPELVGISEQDAAAVMAITADRLSKPIENLNFKSIKLVEE